MDSAIKNNLVKQAMVRGYSQNEAVNLVALIERDMVAKGYEYVYTKYLSRLIG